MKKEKGGLVSLGAVKQIVIFESETAKKCCRYHIQVFAHDEKIVHFSRN